MQRKRPIQVKFRMSEDEAAQLRSKVEQSGMSQQEYLIRAATGQPILDPISRRNLQAVPGSEK